MASGIKITFSASVAKSLKHRMSKEIIESAHEDKGLRKEMMYYFHLANDRIRNLEAAGLLSPALAHIDGRFYSSSDWNTMKERYAEAISFLNEPTSTVRGARTFKNYVRSRAGMDDKRDLFEELYKQITERFTDVVDEFTAKLNYKDIIQSIYDEASEDVSSAIEREARTYADNLEKQIKQQADAIADQTFNTLEYMANEIGNSLLGGLGE